MIVNQTPYPISFEMKTAQALTCRYGEVGRQYKFIADIDLTGLSANVQVIKPDGTFVIEEATVTVTEDEQYIVVEIPLQATVVKGVCRYDINLFQDEDLILYTAEGPLWVDDQLITEDMIESVAEVYGLRFPEDFLTIDMIPEIAEQVAAQVLPEVLPAERGFYLRASQDTGDPEWSPIDMPYPGYGASDAGKALTVNADGSNVEWKKVQHVYSTQEQVVGKWIDGSTIYEKTYEVTNINSDNNYVIEPSFTKSAIKLLPGCGAVLQTTGTYNTDFALSVIDEDGAGIRVFTNINGLNFNVAKYNSHSSQYGTCSALVTIRYTKTS